MDDLTIWPLFSTPLAATKLHGLDNKKILDVMRTLEGDERKYSGSNVINTSDQQILELPELQDLKK